MYEQNKQNKDELLQELYNNPMVGDSWNIDDSSHYREILSINPCRIRNFDLSGNTRLKTYLDTNKEEMVNIKLVSRSEKLRKILEETDELKAKIAILEQLITKIDKIAQVNKDSH